MKKVLVILLFAISINSSGYAQIDSNKRRVDSTTRQRDRNRTDSMNMNNRRNPDSINERKKTPPQQKMNHKSSGTK